MDATFKCDNCGREFPVSQMKEVFFGDGPNRTKQRLDPRCLDEKMNEADAVKGVAGEEKRAAVRIVDGGAGSDAGTDRESLGQRPT